MRGTRSAGYPGQMRTSSIRVVVLGVLAAALPPVVFGGCVGATNPYDPEAPPELQAKATLLGTVTNGGAPAAARVTLAGGDATVSDDTDEDGRYTLQVVPGTYALVVTADGADDFARDVILSAGDSRTIDVELTARTDGTGIAGIARKAAVVDDPAPDHSGIIVEIAGTSLRGVTNASGAYFITTSPGTFTLALSAPDHLNGSITNVAVEAGVVTELAPVTLDVNPGSISGTVTLEPLVPGATTHGGVTVTAGSRSVVTGDDDGFQITGLPAGPIVVRFTRAEYVTQEKLALVTAGALTSVDGVQLVRATGTVTGTVVPGDLADRSGVTVTLSGTAGSFAGTSATTGAFSVVGVPSGVYQLRASRPGFSPTDAGAVEVLPAQTVTIAGDIRLDPLIGDFLINGGAAFTTEPTVTLTLAADGAVQMRLSEDSAFSGVVAQAFDASPDFTLSPGDGDKTIYLELIDADGAVTGPFSSSITLDTEAPVPVVVRANGGDDFTNDAAGIVVLELVATDLGSGVSAMQLSVDGTFDTEPFVDYATALAYPIVPNVDGTYSVSARFRDGAGNETDALDALFDSITLDRVAPDVLSVAINDDDDFAFSPLVSVRIDASADATAMALSTDDNFPTTVFEALSSPTSFFLAPGEGARTVAVKVRDAAGNISGVGSDTITVDTQAPQAGTILVAGGAAVTNDSTPVIALSAQGATRVRLSLDGAFAADGSDFVSTFPTSAPALGADGIKTVFAQFADDAGNLSAVVADTVELDTVGPVLGASAVVLNAGAAFTSSVSATAAFDVSGASQVAVAVDGAVDTESFQPFATALTVLLPAGDCAPGNDDCITVCARFRDEAGNTTAADACDAITLDTTTPSAPLIVEDDFVTNDSDVDVHIVSDSPDAFFSHYEVLLDPVSPAFTDATVAVAVGGERLVSLPPLAAPAGGTASADGAEVNIVRLRAVDLAGNVSPESAITVVVDTIAPDAPVLAGAPSVTNADTLSVNFAVGTNTADADATFSHYRVSTSLLPQPFDTIVRDGIVVTLLPESENIISVVAVDEAGNTSGADSVTVRHDSLAPTAPTISPLFAEARRGPVEIGIVTPSIDSFNDDADPEPEPHDVPIYQMKDGVGESFKASLAGQPLFASLRPGRENEVCVRGLDFIGGNVSIEDCALIEETSMRNVTANIDQAGFFDVFGDVLVFDSGGDVVLRDMRTDDDTLIAQSGTDFGAVRSSDTNSMFVSGDARTATVVYTSPNGRITIARADLSQSPPVITRGQFAGTQPYIHKNDVVYVAAGRVRHRSAVVPAVFNAGDLGTDLSGAVTLCPGTGPRAAESVVVWCEDTGTGFNVRRHIVGDAAGSGDLLNDDNVSAVRSGSLLGGGFRVQQPQVADGTIAWVQDDLLGDPVAVYLPLAGDRRAPASGRIVTDIPVDDLRDLARGFIASVNVHEGLTSDIGTADLVTGVRGLLTNDTSPQDLPAFDGTRLFYADTNVGDLIAAVDVSGLRWVRATSELAFQSVTGKDVTTWIEAVDGQIRLLARKLPIESNPIVAIDAPAPGNVTFFGPAKADAPFQVGGRRVVFSVGTAPPFALHLREIAPSGQSTGAVVPLVADAAGPFALDPDGDSLVYVDTVGVVKSIVLPPTLPATLSVTTVALATNTGDPIIMMDLDDGLLVVQRGGNPDRSTGAESTGEVACAGGGQTGVISTNLRGPKVAHINDGSPSVSFLFAATVGGDAAHFCTLVCAASPVCVPEPASSGLGTDQSIQVTRDARIAYLNDETGLMQVAVFDVFARRWGFVTSGDVERGGLSAAERRITWDDPSLGGFAVFELTLP